MNFKVWGVPMMLGVWFWSLDKCVSRGVFIFLVKQLKAVYTCPFGTRSVKDQFFEVIVVSITSSD